MVGHPRCVFINYIGLISCRTQLIRGTYMFITQVSTTCFGVYGHLQFDELTKTHKQLYLACVFYTVEGGVSFVGWGYEISCVMCREGGLWVCIHIHIIPNIIDLKYTKLRLAQQKHIYSQPPLPTHYTRDLVPPSNKKNPPLHRKKDACQI